MNSEHLSKRTFLAASFAAVCGLVAPRAAAGEQRFRIGTFDSRAVAVAAVNSAAFAAKLKEVRADYDAAKAANDTVRMKQIEARMQTKQRRQHEQGFSTASVMNLLEPVKKELSAVAKAAGVNLIVSKWEVAYQAAGTDVVDVTDQIVELFKPSPRALKWVEDLKKKAPIPLDALPEHID